MDSGSSTPTSQTVTQTSIPEYAQPYVETMLGQAAALTDINANPYMQYQGDRTAQFAPMQQQAMENAALMATSPQLEQGTALAGQAGLMGLGLMGAYDPSKFRSQSFTGTGVAKNYMSPYTQNVVDVQQAEAKRQAAIAGQGQQAAAARAGAFGGARDIINRNEANRALQTQLAGIQATGLQNAYQQAQSQFNAEQQARQQAAQLREQSRQFGADLGTRGLQTALQGAQVMGGLGQQQFGQAMDINKLQAAYGGQQQQQVQNILNQQYQDFLNYQNYPYKQLGFMSDMLRGLPLMQQSQAMYGGQPSPLQTMAGLGLGAYGLSRMADGGLAYAGGSHEPIRVGYYDEETRGYADGGSVTGDDFVTNALRELSNAQLTQAKQAALARQDMRRARMIDEEMARRAAMSRGIGAGLSEQAAERMMPSEESMARGGIVAFAEGGDMDYRSLLQESMTDTPMRTPEQEREGITAQREFLKQLQGPNLMAPYLEDVKAERGRLKQDLEKETGMGMVEAAAALLSRPGIGAVGDAMKAYTGRIAQAKKDNAAADRMLRQSEIQLAGAQQAREDGNTSQAMARADKADELRIAAAQKKREAAVNAAKVLGGIEEANIRSKSAKEVAQIQAAPRPGETERIQDRIDAISKGDATFGGKSGKEGVDMYLQSLSAQGAARLGARYTGQDRSESEARQATQAALTAAQKDPRMDPLKLSQTMNENRISKLEAAKKPVPPEMIARRNAIASQIQSIQQEYEQKFNKPGAAARTPAPGAAPQQSAAPSLQEFMSAARASNPNATDEQLQAYWQRTYGAR